jgi:hypothetical protein
MRFSGLDSYFSSPPDLDLVKPGIAGAGDQKMKIKQTKAATSTGKPENKTRLTVLSKMNYNPE